MIFVEKITFVFLKYEEKQSNLTSTIYLLEKWCYDMEISIGYLSALMDVNDMVITIF